MSNKEYTLSQAEVREMLSNRHQKQPYKMKGHSWVPLKGAGKNVCSCCGLMALRNKATDWAIAKGCHHTDHPQYENAMKRLTKMKW